MAGSVARHDVVDNRAQESVIGANGAKQRGMMFKS